MSVGFHFVPFRVVYYEFVFMMGYEYLDDDGGLGVRPSQCRKYHREYYTDPVPSGGNNDL